MDTRKKLSEANYFLDLLPNCQVDEKKLNYNLSAFLNAWRSVLDIMLYDFAEHYALGFTREVELNDKEFSAVATAMGKTKAVEFIKWWRRKQGELKNDPLWEKRIISFHRGNVEIYQTVYALGTGSSSGTITWTTSAPMGGPTPAIVSGNAVTVTAPVTFWSFADFPNEDLIVKCREGFLKLEAIVREAEATFRVDL